MCLVVDDVLDNCPECKTIVASKSHHCLVETRQQEYWRDPKTCTIVPNPDLILYLLEVLFRMVKEPFGNSK